MVSAQRFPTKEKASLEVYGRPGTHVVDVVDLSKTGACLQLNAQQFSLNKGDVIRITIILKALNRRHDVSAEVVWVKDNHSGINFIPADKVLEKIIAN